MPETTRLLLMYIRAGGHPHVAAEAAGLPRAQFTHCMEQGASARAGSRPGAFFHAVCQAHAQARLRAETTVFEKRPLDWLRSGPGKERPDDLGWTSAPRALPRPSAARDFHAVDPQWQAVVRVLLQSLTPYPELRVRIAAALSSWIDHRRPASRRRAG
jgi:hypothetical protein